MLAPELTRPDVRVVSGQAALASLPEWTRFWQSLPPGPIGADPRWLAVLAEGLGHLPYAVEARIEGELAGLLPLALVRGPLFGRFLVSLPFVSSCGVLSEDSQLAEPLVERAIELADELRVKHLELRHSSPLEHPALTPSAASKVLMQRSLPDTAQRLWKDLDSKVRNQVRKGEKQSFVVEWGREDLLASFYAIFSRNMRDLGTPVFGRRMFLAILKHFSPAAEFCVVHLNSQPVAAALLVHGRGITKVPCASTLRQFNATNANMFLYWQLLQRAIERGSATFDFGRSTVGSGTERFKAQWGADAAPAVWQCYYRYYRRRCKADLRKESPLFATLTRAWRYLPLRVAEFVGPAIVCGIP
ncbi:MAG: FemAB family XrtA/PEP-CTERM system-associated protein [Pirellulaceae bacterium]